MGDRSRSSGRRPTSGRHSLKSRRLAAELVACAEVTARDLVVEVGAGRGKLTSELIERARHVIAIELDPSAIHLLVDRFKSSAKLSVVYADALTFPYPADRFRVVGNIPFGITTDLLRRLLDDPSSSLQRADLIVEEGAARKRVSGRNLLSLSWLPWWTLRIGRRFSPLEFEPPPRVSAALFIATRRTDPLLPMGERRDFLSLLRAGFGTGTLWHSLLSAGVSRSIFLASCERAGLPKEARPYAMTVEEWIAFYKAIKSKEGFRFPAQPQR